MDQKTLASYLPGYYTNQLIAKLATLSDDIAVDDGWSISSTLFQKTVKQLEVIREVVL